MGEPSLSTTLSSPSPTPSQSPSTTRDSSPASSSASPQHQWRHRSLLSKLRTATLHLTPAFFTITMGTGIVSILLYNLPYNAEWLRRVGIVVFVLNVVVFVALLCGTVVRCVLFRGVWKRTLLHPVSSMFWGAVSMGMTTIVNMIGFTIVPAWGRSWAYLAVVLFYINFALAILTCIGMLFILISRQSARHTHETVAATWLLPVISAVVVSSSGAVVAHPLMPYDPALARSTVIVAYVVWGIGTPTALMLVAMWLYRSALFGYPPRGAITAVFLPLGPCGQASFGIAIMGRVVRDLAYTHATPLSPLLDTEASRHVADAIYAGGLVVALVIWGLGAVFYLLATAIVIDYQRAHGDFFSRGTFALNYWSLTFPIGVFATGATELAEQLDSTAFRVIGTILSLQVVLHWMWVAGMTLCKCADGSLFAAPEVMGEETPLRFMAVRSTAEKAAQRV